MPEYPEPMAETSGGSGSRRMVVAPARVPRAGRGLNDLPREVLVRVLSFLEARQAVQTCVLSELWRDIWRSMPRINASRYAFEIYDVNDPLFKKFINRLLMLRNQVPLDEFRLWYSLSTGDARKESEEATLWINHALLCNARSVEIFVWEDKLEPCPPMFISQHLTSLLLYSVIFYRGFFRELQTGCKALERLMLQNCSINDIEIASQTLKFLSIGIECELHDEQASISLPNLIHLGFFNHSPYPRIPLLKNMESLETAYINMFQFHDLPVDDIRQFLLGLCGVTKLEFCFGETELMMGMNLQWCPKFNNLQILCLGKWYLDENFYGLIAFLQNSPNLVHLTLDLQEIQHAEVPEALTGRPGKRRFTCEHLKTVEIICSLHRPVVNNLKKFLVGNGISAGQIHIKQISSDHVCANRWIFG